MFAEIALLVTLSDLCRLVGWSKLLCVCVLGRLILDGFLKGLRLLVMLLRRARVMGAHVVSE